MECLLFITLSIFIMTPVYIVLHRATIREGAEYHNSTINSKVSFNDFHTRVTYEYFPTIKDVNVLKLSKSNNITIFEMLEANRSFDVLLEANHRSPPEETSYFTASLL